MGKIIMPDDYQFGQNSVVDFDDSRFPGWDLNKMENVFNVSSEVIECLSPEAVDMILGATDERGMNKLFDSILEETYSTLYGSQENLKKNRNNFNQSFGYLDKLSEDFEETLRVEDLTYFITSLMPDFEMNWHHYEWSQIEMKIPRYAVIAARDHGKSFFFSNAACCWRLYRFKGKRGKNQVERNNRGFLFSFSLQQAVDLLEILKTTIEENDVLREKLYNKDSWTATNIICANRARLTVKGFGSSVRGAHPAWIRIDDGLKDNVLYSKQQREKSNNYLQAVIMNMIVPGGTVGIVGTPFHSNDMYGDLKNKKNWKVFEYPAIYPDGRLLWDNRWDYKGLMDKKYCVSQLQVIQQYSRLMY
jgi:hypothetical protein